MKPPTRFSAAFLSLILGMPSPVHDRSGQEPAAGNGAASSSRSHALRIEAPVQSGAEERLLHQWVPAAGMEEVLAAFQEFHGWLVGEINRMTNIPFHITLNRNGEVQAVTFFPNGKEGVNPEKRTLQMKGRGYRALDFDSREGLLLVNVMNGRFVRVSLEGEERVLLGPVIEMDTASREALLEFLQQVGEARISDALRGIAKAQVTQPNETPGEGSLIVELANQPGRFRIAVGPNGIIYSQLPSAAGAEEKAVRFVLRRATSEWAQYPKEDPRFEQLAFDFDSVPANALVVGANGTWWVHFHAGYTGGSEQWGYEPGFVAELIRKEGRFTGIREILVEPIVPPFFVSLGQVLSDLAWKAVPLRMESFLIEKHGKALEAAVKTILETGIDPLEPTAQPQILARAMGDDAGLYAIEPSGNFNSQGQVTFQVTQNQKEIFQRLDLPRAPPSHPAAGAEELRVRSVLRKDTGAVLNTELSKIMQGIRPWDGRDIVRHMKTPRSKPAGFDGFKGDGIVVENQKGEILGHLFWLEERDHFRVVNFGLQPQARLPAVAGLLLNWLKQWAKNLLVSRITAEVPREDRPFFEGNGFIVLDILRDYFPSLPVQLLAKDAYRMEYAGEPRWPVSLEDPRVLEDPTGTFIGPFGPAMPVLQVLFRRMSLIDVEIQGVELKLPESPRADDIVIEIGLALREGLTGNAELKESRFRFERSGRLLKVSLPAAGAEEALAELMDAARGPLREIVLPAAPYLNAAGVEEGDFAGKILSDRFA